MAQPTYKDLLDLLEQAESQTGSHLSTAELLTVKFSERYPHIAVSRPGCFLDTVKRITAPLVSGRLQGDEKEEYLKREWTPRIRNPHQGLSNTTTLRCMCTLCQSFSSECSELSHCRCTSSRTVHALDLNQICLRSALVAPACTLYSRSFHSTVHMYISLAVLGIGPMW